MACTCINAYTYHVELTVLKLMTSISQSLNDQGLASQNAPWSKALYVTNRFKSKY